MRSWTFASVVLWLTFGVVPARALAAGSCGAAGARGTQVMVEFQGSVYYVTTPPGYADDRAWPLIFGLHGDEGDPARSVNFSWRTVQSGQFIFVAPKAPNPGGSWYKATETNSQWMDALLASLLAKYNVDLDRISIWGLSGGAVFISTYALARQDVFAAVEFNMGGSGRRLMPVKCKIPARFVVSMNDFLRPQAQQLYQTLMTAGHETVWVDAACDGHCFDRLAAGPNARDWLLAHTLCGATPTPGCRAGVPAPDGGSTPADAGSAPVAPTADARVPDLGGTRAPDVRPAADAGIPRDPPQPPARDAARPDAVAATPDAGGTASPEEVAASSGCKLAPGTVRASGTNGLALVALAVGLALRRRRARITAPGSSPVPGKPASST